jgi:hypothetical protein
MVWSHIQAFYHASKDSRVGTVPLYGSKGYPYSRVPTGLLDDDLILEQPTPSSGVSRLP